MFNDFSVGKSPLLSFRRYLIFWVMSVFETANAPLVLPMGIRQLRIGGEENNCPTQQPQEHPPLDARLPRLIPSVLEPPGGRPETSLVVVEAERERLGNFRGRLGSP